MKLLLLAPLVVASAVSAGAPTRFSLYGPPTQQAYLAALVRQPFFDRVVSQGVDLISSILADIEIPTLAESVHVPVIGDVNIDIARAQVLALSIDSARSSITLANDYFAVGIGGLSLDFKSEYKYKQKSFPKLGGHGTGTVAVRDGTIAFDLRLGFTPEGSIAASIDRVYTKFGKINIDVEEGTAKWLYNVVFDLFSSLIKKEVNKQIETQLSTGIPNALNKALENLNLDIQVSNLLEIDARLAGDAPIIKPSGLVLFDDLAIGSLKSDASCPYLPEPATAVVQSLPNMVVASVHEATVNCALWALRDEGILSLKVDNSQLPAGIAILETESWEEVFPGMAREYPGKGIQLGVHFDEDIKATVEAGKGLRIKANVLLDWFVDTPAPVMVTEVKLEALVVPSLIKSSTGDWKLKIDLAQAGPTADDVILIGGRIVSTEVLPADEELFDETLGILAPIIVSVLDDALLKNGFDLPIPKEYVDLTAAQVLLTEKQINLGADLNLGPAFF